jgi:hypothetical protein
LLVEGAETCQGDGGVDLGAPATAKLEPVLTNGALRQEQGAVGAARVHKRRGGGRRDAGALLGLRDVDRMLKASPHTDEHFLETWLLGQRVLAEAA